MTTVNYLKVCDCDTCSKPDFNTCRMTTATQAKDGKCSNCGKPWLTSEQDDGHGSKREACYHCRLTTIASAKKNLAMMKDEIAQVQRAIERAAERYWREVTPKELWHQAHFQSKTEPSDEEVDAFYQRWVDFRKNPLKSI